jgi:guanyl-specific ribonuclease Sa
MHTRRHRFMRKTKGKKSRSRRRSRRGGGTQEQNEAMLHYTMRHYGS